MVNRVDDIDLGDGNGDVIQEAIDEAIDAEEAVAELPDEAETEALEQIVDSQFATISALEELASRVAVLENTLTTQADVTVVSPPQEVTVIPTRTHPWLKLPKWM